MNHPHPESILDFLSPLSAVPGLGPRRQGALAEAGIENVGALLRHFPRRYINRSTIVPISALAQHADGPCSVIGTVTRTRVERGRKPRLRIQVDDGTGTMEALWFAGVSYYRASIRSGMRLLLTGKADSHPRPQMVHPQIETIGEGKTLPDVVHLPQYRISLVMREAGIGQKTLYKSIDWVLRNLKHYPQVLPRRIEEKKGFPPLPECLRQLHTPDDPALLEPYRARVIYEEIYTTALTLRWSRRKFAQPGRSLKAGDLADRFKKGLPFTLTAEQEQALDVLAADAAAPRRMHRLLQGDVGCGKTVVAFMSCLPALNSGCQVAWLAPTEVLAYQTWMQAAAWLKPLGFEAVLLTGGVTGSRRQAMLKGISSGSVRFVVGTHALLGRQVSFARLGMAVIDEQHKFGVDQRSLLQEKDPAADFLLMSATPIPQTLAQTLYNDLDLCTINASPEGRIPVSTHLVPQPRRKDMEDFILREMTGNNSQAYYVVPRIEKDDGDEEGDDLADATSSFERLARTTFSDIPASFLHGRMPADEKERVVRDFSSGATRLLVSTTVVEVGIDAQNATVMVIENAERFGLSQLHQLRGRVGRGTKKSYCFLLAQPTGNGLADQRLREFCSMHDGFKIAELDLRSRGPGQAAGLRQSGWDDMEMAAIMDNLDLFSEIQRELDVVFSEKTS